MDVLLIGFESQENLGLRSIAAFLQSRGVRAGIQPMQGVAKEEILRRIVDAKPKIVGFSLIFQRMLPMYAELIDYLGANGTPGHFTIGGPSGHDLHRHRRGSDDELKTINKGYGADAAYQAIDVLQQSEVLFDFGFMLLTPDTTFDTLAENIRFLQHAAGSGAIVGFTKMVPYAGTTIRQRLAAEGRLRGTAWAPDDSYDDQRMNLLQHFITQTFRKRNFADDGLCEQLRFARFDALVARRITGWDTTELERGLSDLIRRSNDSALDALAFANAAIGGSDLDSVIEHWDVLEATTRSALATDEELAAELCALIDSKAHAVGMETATIAG